MVTRVRTPRPSGPGQCERSGIWDLQTMRHLVRAAPFLFSCVRLKAFQAVLLL